MILEPKHKNFTGPSEIKETVNKRFNIRRHMSTPRAFECFYFKIILNWWHSPFKYPYRLCELPWFFPSTVVRICVSVLVAKVAALLMALQVEFCKSEKRQNPEVLRILVLFFRFSKFHFWVPLHAMQSVSTFSVFPSAAVQIHVRAPWRYKRWHFAWPVMVHRSGILQIWKKVPES